MLTAKENNIEIAQALIVADAALNLQNAFGKSALHVASEKNHTEMSI